MSKILAFAAALGLVLALGTFEAPARSGGSGTGVGISGGPKKPGEPCCNVKKSTATSKTKKQPLSTRR